MHSKGLRKLVYRPRPTKLIQEQAKRGVSKRIERNTTYPLYGGRKGVKGRE